MIELRSARIATIPGSSKCVKFVTFHPKNLPKGRNFTYLEDPGMHAYFSIVSMYGIFAITYLHLVDFHGFHVGKYTINGVLCLYNIIETNYIYI